MGLIKNGYKQTELGLIPNDWEIKEFQDVMTGFFSGATPYRGRPDYYKGSIKWITSGELNYNVITDTIEKITEEAVKNTNLKILPTGTFLFAITGLEAEGTRGSCGITGVEATTNQSCMALFPKESLDSKYLYHFYVWQGKMLAFRYCQGTKQQSYTGKIARTLPIILPPTKSEQAAIADALSDTDALIENLENLIAKKQNIKQGAMQELLCGRRRLAGFKENWETKLLGEISDIKTGKKNNDDKIEEGLYPFFVRSQTVEKINSFSFDGEAILIPGEGNIGSIYHYINGKFDYHQRVYKISNFDATICGKYIYFQMLQNFNVHAMKNTVKATVDSLRLPTFQKFEIYLPSQLEEQKAIANILSDIEKGIEILNDKLNKYKMIKQSLMQALLTGKNRLL
jgi:type I restriction enzyme S subunit